MVLAVLLMANIQHEKKDMGWAVFAGDDKHERDWPSQLQEELEKSWVTYSEAHQKRDSPPGEKLYAE